MSEQKCYRCFRPLFSEREDFAYKRVCCGILLHRLCITDMELERCPSCELDTASSHTTMVWIPIARPTPDVIVIQDPDEPPAKRPKVDGALCVICLQEGMGVDKLLSTKCCSQKAHVSCLRTYYQLPAKIRSRRDRYSIAKNLGMPNCFVCRGDRHENIPLGRNALNAILPQVSGQWSEAEANVALSSWQRMLEYEMSRWVIEWLYSLSLDAGTVTVRYKNGQETKSRFKGFECKPFYTFPSLLTEQLIDMLPDWAGLPATASRFDRDTCKNFCLHQICELTLQLIVSNYCMQARRSGASPFKVERFNKRFSTWICTGHFFDFDEMIYEGGRKENANCTSRTSYWHYKNVLMPSEVKRQQPQLKKAH